MTQYFKDLAERVLVAFATAFLGTLGGGAVNLFDVDWKAGFGIGGGAALAMLLLGLTSRGVGDPNTAGLTTRKD